jgi:hypothetical protein
MAQAQVMQIDAPELFNGSALVFEGVAFEVNRSAYEDEDGNPYTRVRFSISEIYYGDYWDNEIEFLIPGGISADGESILTISGTPDFHEGITYLLFITSGPWYTTPVTNLWRSIAELVNIEGQYYWADQYGNLIKDFDMSGFVRGTYKVDLDCIWSCGDGVAEKKPEIPSVPVIEDLTGTTLVSVASYTPPPENINDYLNADEIISQVIDIAQQSEYLGLITNYKKTIHYTSSPIILSPDYSTEVPSFISNCAQGAVVNSISKCWVCNDGYYVNNDQKECALCPDSGCKRCADNTGLCTECKEGHIRHPINGICKSCSNSNCKWCGEHSSTPTGDWCYECYTGTPINGEC